MRILFRCVGLTLALLLVAGSVVRAQDDPTVNVGSVPTGNASSFNYDVNGSTRGSFSSLPTGPFDGSSISPGTVLNGALFCVDLWHGQLANQSWQGTSYSGSVTHYLTTLPTGVVADSALLSKLDYLGYVSNAVFNGGGTTSVMNSAEAAIQLAIWRLIDTNNSAGTSGGLSVTTDGSGKYSTIESMLGGTTQSSFGGASNVYGYNTTGYNTLTTTYSALFLLVNTGYTGQNMLTWTPVAVPEPSSMAIAGLGALGMIGYGVRRRKSF